MEIKRRNFTADEKAKIIRRHLIDKIPVSDLCEECGIQPTVYYRWQKALFENAAEALNAKGGRGKRRKQKREEERVEALEKKLGRKNEVLSELMEEHVALKKKLGEI